MMIVYGNSIAEFHGIRQWSASIKQAIQFSGKGVQHYDWFVFGALAEQYGLIDTALEYYSRVSKPATGDPENTSTYALARARIAKLKKKNTAG